MSYIEFKDVRKIYKTGSVNVNALDGCDRITDIYLPDSILDLGNVGKKDYDTGEYYFTIHCKENSEAQRRLDAKGIPWEAW